jgi:tetratricopeptide (TPR) repeat protein
VRAGDDVTESAAASNLGLAYWRSGRFPEAVAQYLRALAIAERTGNQIREARALGNLGVVYWQLGRRGEALDCEERAHGIGLRTGDPPASRSRWTTSV